MTQLGKYDILEELGRGGFGIVYKARDFSLDRVVALKVLHPQLTVDPSFLERFRKEARALARVNHPNVVTIYEIGEVEGRVYIAMEYLPGGSLGDRLKDGPLSLEEAIKITGEAAAGLGAGHEEGLVHRDVKPGNILFNKRGEAVVADFGLAKALQISSSSAKSSVGSVGTPYYRPPELWNGTPPPSPATDVYSLACVFYEMLTGQILFDGETPMTVMAKHYHGPEFIMGSSVSDNLVTVLNKALAKEPSQRYQSMGLLVSALKQPQKTQERSQKLKAVEFPSGSGRQREVKPSTASSTKSPQESQASRSQRGQTASGAKSTAPEKKGMPAWVPWTVVWVLGVALVLPLTLRGLVGGRLEPTEVAQGTELSEQNSVPTLTEETTREELQPTLTKTKRSTRTSTVTQTPKSVFGIGSTMVNPKDSAEMVYVPEGEFLMGSEDDDAYSDAAPEHTVYLDAYWIYKHEVTNAQYAEFLNDQGNQTEGGRTWLNADAEYTRIHQSGGDWFPDSGYGDHPV